MGEFKFLADQEGGKQRLDKFLLDNLLSIKPEMSRNRVQSLIEDGAAFLASDQNKPLPSCSYKVKPLDEILIIIPPAKSCEVLPQDIKIDVVFEDENMLVINKQSNIITHPGNGIYEDTLVNALLFHCKDNLSGINGVMRPGIVHRLDKNTSGLMVVAKNDLAHNSLAKQIQDRALKRNYLAICYGLPRPLKGVIEKNIERSRVNRLKMVVTKTSGRHATTNYEVKKIYKNSSFSLIECQLETGRTHQIRVHMSSIGHSIVGDQSYGSRNKSPGDVDDDLRKYVNNFPRQALHSYKISFLHPVSGERLEFERKWPDDIEELDKRLS